MRILLNISNDFYSHWIAKVWILFNYPYFWYDTYAMYVAYWVRHTEVQRLSHFEAFTRFVRRDPVIFIHHVFLPPIAFPVLLVNQDIERQVT